MYKAFLLLSAALMAFAPTPSFAADAPSPQVASSFSEAQRADIENIIKEYLTNKHPEVMAQGLQSLQKREQDEATSKTKEKVVSEKSRIFNDASSPIAGNPKGNVTIVEFYDYQCGYCKLSEEGIERLLKEDKDVKFVYKNFPVLGPVSVEAAKAALASAKQGKFQAFHNALMKKKDHLSSDMIYQVAKDAGLNVEKLKKDMAENSIDDSLSADLKLGQDIGVHGTPMFVMSNNSVFPGALQYEQLKKVVSEARSEAKKP